MIDFRDIGSLLGELRAERISLHDLVDVVADGIDCARRPEAWLYRIGREELHARADALAALGDAAKSLSLFGVPFAVKDNIDVAGVPTTAGCPAYAYTPETDSFAVRLLLDAGAILVGRTHMDQFATGLVGTRSPQGPCRNAHFAEYISGGSSSGSAVVVAEGLVSFALGTDTAGSGRVPAVLNGVVGLKPTRGRVSTRGVVPACASIDCVSVFAAGARDAGLVLDVLGSHDERDPYSRPCTDAPLAGAGFRLGVPRAADLGLDADAAALFEAAVVGLERCGATRVDVDYSPLREAAALVYGGAWVAERYVAVGEFIESHREAVDPVVASLILGAKAKLGDEVAAESRRRLSELSSRIAPVWRDVDVLAVPTVARPFRIAEVQSRPREASELFAVTNNFMNLLDMAGVAVPTGVFACGVPFGVTLAAPANADRMLLDVAARLERRVSPAVPRLWRPGRIALAVVGAHLRGMPLHQQLVDLGARFVTATKTSADYKFYALKGTTPPKPGLRRVAVGGSAIEVEVYALTAEAFGRFTAAVPRPLAIGRLSLEDGSEVSGFVCEPDGLDGAEEITSYGGWRAYCGR